MDGGQADPDQAGTILRQVGTNAPNGVIFDYYFKQKNAGEIRLTLYNAKGDSITSFSNKKDLNGQAVKAKADFYADKKAR